MEDIEGLATCDLCGRSDDHTHTYEDYGFPDRESMCPACGSPIDYCQGHGEIGDPRGWAILQAHDSGDHTMCHIDGCDEHPDHKDPNNE